MLFQSMERIEGELQEAIAAEKGTYVSVNIFEWEGRGIHMKESNKNYDVEINLYNQQGKRIDNWVVEIIWMRDLSRQERIQVAKRQASKVLRTVSKWFPNGSGISVAQGIRLYTKREDAEFHYTTVR